MTPAQIYRELRRRRAKAAIINLDAPGPSTSAEAQAVLDRMSALTATEEEAIATYVDAEVSAGNWALIDEFYCFALNSTDWLTGFKAKTATAGAGTPTRTSEGASFNGSSTINTGFDATNDSTNWALSDFFQTCFLQSYTGGATANMYALSNGVRNKLSRNQSFDRLEAFHNASTGELGRNNLDLTDFAAKSLYGHASNSTAADTYKDGVSIDSATITPSSVDAGNFYVGGAAVGGSLTGVVSCFAVGGANGFDFAAHNTNVRAFLSSLGVTIS